VGLSKQALDQAKKRAQRKQEESKQFFEQASALRRKHPGKSCRQMAEDLKIRGWGRDKLEQWLLHNGFRNKKLRYVPRTTQAQRAIYFPNLIDGREVNGIWQVVQADLTYFKVGGKDYFIHLIIDVYTRKIVGYAVSRTMHATGTIQAMEMMLRNRKIKTGTMIHHSDRGHQYVSKEYLKLLRKNNIKSSMCTEAWENAYIERFNRTIKEGYLQGWDIKNYDELVHRVDQAIDHYNTERKHRSLQGWCPANFEISVQKMPERKRPVMKIYKKEINNQ
jgi:putative transposase